MEKTTLEIKDLAVVDDAGGTHYECVMTAGFIVEAVEEGLLRFENNIRPDWHVDAKMQPKTRRKIDRWSEEILQGDAALGNLSVRLDPSTPHEFTREEETGSLSLVIEPQEDSAAIDTAVDSQSRIMAIVRAHEKQPALFNPDLRIAVRIWVAPVEEAHKIGAAYNTRGDKVNDSAAKYAYAAAPAERIASALVKGSGNPHLSTDNIEVLSNTVSSNSQKLAGFNTIVKAIENEWVESPVTEHQVAAMSKYISDLWYELVEARPEYGVSTIRDRKAYRNSSLAGSALALYGAMAVINACYAKKMSAEEAKEVLAKLAPTPGQDDWASKDNAIWQQLGVLVSATLKDGSTVLRTRNTFQSRRAVADEFLKRCDLL